MSTGAAVRTRWCSTVDGVRLQRSGVDIWHSKARVGPCDNQAHHKPRDLLGLSCGIETADDRGPTPEVADQLLSLAQGADVVTEVSVPSSPTFMVVSWTDGGRELRVIVSDCHVRAGAELINHVWDPVVPSALRLGVRGLVVKVTTGSRRYAAVYQLTSLETSFARGPLAQLAKWAAENQAELSATSRSLSVANGSVAHRAQSS